MKPVLLGIDIDGVFNIMNQDDKNNDLSKTCVYYLNEILAVLPHCEVLITSCWGNHNNHTVETLVESGFEYPERVVGATRMIFVDKCPRTHEIKEWLEENDKIDYYEHKVYLDDEISLFEYLEKGISKYEVVECRPDRGLDMDKFFETVCKLQGINPRFWS